MSEGTAPGAETPRSGLSEALRGAGPLAFSTYAIAAAFGAYFCMYAFRKPFAAATFEGQLGDLDLKLALVLSQIVGYALSKFIGIRLVAGPLRAHRVAALLALVGLAELALLAFGLLPPGGKVVAIFFNGLPLGCVWGLVFSFLEGRRTTEVLGAGLSASYIVASGIVKSVGRGLMDAGVPEGWMPFVTGLCFAPPFALAVFLLSRLPAPNEGDEDARTKRREMSGAEQAAFFGRFWPGLVALTFIYMFLTAYRDFRDNFAAELFEEMGESSAGVFALTETWVTPAVLLALAAIFLVRDNRRALFVIHALMAGGSALIALATLAHGMGAISGVVWITLVGIGLYLAYVPYGCVLFDRLIAATRVVATSVFMIYVTDAFGYLGSILVLLYKNFGSESASWVEFFTGFSWATSLVCLAGFGASWVYFWRAARGRTDDPTPREA